MLHLPYSLPILSTEDKGLVKDGEYVAAKFEIIKDYHKEDQLYEQTSFILTKESIKVLKFLIDYKYNLKVMIGKKRLFSLR